MDHFDSLQEKQIEFIQKQKLYFIGTAGAEGRVNVSPKGLDSLRVKDANTVRWLNLTGSGNETAAHVLENQRMTIMFCSFDKQPLILRLYGQAVMISTDDPHWGEAMADFNDHPGARQVFELNVDLVQTSCGYAVPFYEFTGERETLDKWTANKDKKGLAEYQQAKNRLSLDNKPTGLPPAK